MFLMKSYLIILTVLIFTACDKRMDYDYFIVNNCDEIINVYIETDRNDVSKSIVILSYETELIYHGTGINGLQDGLVEFFFKKITVYKVDKTSKVNYIDRNLWVFEPVSGNHANSYLTINPGDFEDE